MSYTSKTARFEDIIDQLGAFGLSQRILLVLISIPDIWAAFSMLLPVFVGATPKWCCSAPNALEMNETLSSEEMWYTCHVNNSQCKTFEYRDEFTSIVSEWDLVCDKDYISDLISSFQMAGLMVGAAIFGLVCDLIGRKKSYFIALLILLSSGFLSAFANSWQLYAACRGLVGVGFASYMIVNCVYPLEFVGSKWRLLCGTLGFWAVGHCMLAPVAYFIRHWRHLTIAVSISGIPCFLLWWVIPESPRWLVQKHRFAEAGVILDKMAARNRKPTPDLTELEQFAETIDGEKQQRRKFTYLDLFRQWYYARITLVSMLLWFSTILIYYEATYNMKHLSGDRYLNMLYSGLLDLVAMVSIIAVLNRLGRKKSLIGCFIICLSSFMTILVIIAIGKDVSMGSVIAYVSMVGKSASSSLIFICQIYSAEIFPTDIRSMGVGVGAMAGRIGGIISPQLVYLGTIYHVAPYIIITTLCVVIIPVSLLLPETNKQPLQDTYVEKETSDGDYRKTDVSSV